MIASPDGTPPQQPQQPRPINATPQANVNRIPGGQSPQPFPGVDPMTPPSMTGAVGMSQGAAGSAPVPPGGLRPSMPTAAPAPSQPPNPATNAPAGPLAAPSSPTSFPAAPTIAPATQSFGPGSDLRATQINPGTTPRLMAVQGQVDQAANKLSSGPDRFGIAQDRFSTFAQQTDPAFQAALRSATQRAAANGTIGSGMLGTDYGNLELARERQLSGERQGIFQNALEGTIGDTRANLGLLAGLEGQQYGQGVDARNELRGERGYQVGQEDQAFQRRRQGVMDQDYLTNSDFGRNVARLQAGEAGNPAPLLAGVGGYQGDQAARQRSLLMDSVYGRELTPPPSATPSPLLNVLGIDPSRINANGIPTSVTSGAWNPNATRPPQRRGVPGSLFDGVTL